MTRTVAGPRGTNGRVRGAGTARLRHVSDALTSRGRFFIGGGAGAVVAGLLLGERDLLRIGVLLIALPLAALWTISRSTFRLSCDRAVEPTQVTAGETATISLTVTSLSRLPTPTLSIEDGLPTDLGVAPRFTVTGLGAGQRRVVGYRLRTRSRAVWDIGPLTVRISDPFGLAEIARSFTSTDRLVVTPALVPLEAPGTAGRRSTGGDGLGLSASLGSEDDIGTRPWRDGDDQRRVHWRTTARTGRLSVRQEASPSLARAGVLLDTRITPASDAWLPQPPGEQAVVAAASVAAALGRRGLAVHVVDAAGTDLVRAAPGDLTGTVPRVLAGVALTTPVADLSGGARALAGESGAVVAIVVRPTPRAVAELATLPSRSGSRAGVLALLIDGPAPTGRSGRAAHGSAGGGEDVEQAQTLLEAGGWTAVVTSADVPLEDAWAELLARAAVRIGMSSTGIPLGGGSR